MRSLGLTGMHSVQFSSVAQSCSTLQPHESQHARPPCSSPAPRVYLNYVHRVSDAIQPSHPLLPPSFSSCPQSVPASESFPMSQLFTSGGKSVGVSASASVFPVNIQGLFPLGLAFFYLLAVQGTLNSLLQHQSLKVSFLQCSAFFTVQFSHPYMTTGKTIALTMWTFVSKVMSLLFNMLSRLVIAFLPRDKHLLIS